MTASAAQRRADAARIMRNPKLAKERDRWIALWNYLLTSEIEAGTQFLRTVPEGGLFAVLGDTHDVVPLPRRGGDRWHAYFHSTYGFGEREPAARFLYDALRSYAFTYGERVELRRFAAYNQTTRTVYLSAYDGHLYKLEGSEQITVETQGIDGVFFADDDGGLGVEPEVGQHGLLLPRLANPNFMEAKGSITPEQQRMALIVWMFAVAFPDLMPTKPILLLEGIKGSGKTSVVTLLQLVLQGMKRPISLRRDREDDFGVQLLRNPIALLDNLDSYIEWLPDALCAYATGAVWEKRRLYTDDETVILRPHAFIAFTTRNPASFRRDDVVDRCVILHFDRRTSFRRMSKLEKGILDDRPKLFGEYLWYIGRIVEVLREGDHESDADEAYRMADFVSFSRVVARVMGWTQETVNDLMQALQADRDAFLIEEDPLIDILNMWITYVYGAHLKKPPNRGRLISIFELASELEHLAETNGLPWKESARTLRQKLRMPHMEAAFRIEQYTHNGHPAFRLWKKTDLRAVGDDEVEAST